MAWIEAKEIPFFVIFGKFLNIDFALFWTLFLCYFCMVFWHSFGSGVLYDSLYGVFAFCDFISFLLAFWEYNMLASVGFCPKSPKEITTTKGAKMAKEKKMENSLQKVLALGALSLGVVAITNAADPATIIKQRCQSCHGPKMERQALGKSKITNTLTPEQIKTSLLGYKAKTLNTFGLGATMWGQAASLSAEDIDALSKYIPTLKGK